MLSPNAFARWDRPYAHYAIFAFDRSGNHSARIAGSDLSVTSKWLGSGELRVENGLIFQNQCSTSHPLCVVTTEPLAVVWSRGRIAQEAYAGLGSIAGFGVGLALALLHLRRGSLAHQLRRDLQKDSPSLSLVYQPILEIQSNQCVGAEALLRWSDNHGAAVPPDIFIPLAEAGCFIREVTERVVRDATRDLGDLLRSDRRKTLSVNISVADLEGEFLANLLHRYVVQADIQPRQLVLELTERCTADVKLLTDSLKQVSQAGYKIHIDDFGIGYSSLSYLDQLSVNAIKIDRIFTKSIGTQAMIAPILPQMLALAESLGMQVVVEGVETEAQAAYLRTTGQKLCVQGWLLGKPMSADRFIQFCQSNAEETASESILGWSSAALEVAIKV